MNEDAVPATGATAGEAASALPFQRLPVELRPDPALMKYYAIVSLAALPIYPFVLVPYYARYRTLRYTIAEDGIAARWGVLFRREVSLNYARIQDIHLSSNVVERWLGLGKIQVQTASGSSKAEMTVEGVPALGAMRDFLYSRMRGAREAVVPDDVATRARAVSPAADDLAETLRAVAAEVRALREELEQAHRAGTDSSSGDANHA